MPQIHPSSVIDPSVEIADDVQIGPFCYIGPNVILGKGCILHNNVSLFGYSTFGQCNEFFPNCVIGQKSMDLKYKGEPTYLSVGDRNSFREGCTISRSTTPEGKTIIGNNNNFLVNSHIGHDCVLGDGNIISGFAGVAGHVHIENCVIISGFAAVHQFVRIGSYSMIGGLARIIKDVPPFTLAEGSPALIRGLNIVGLQRRHFSETDIRALKTAYKTLFFHREESLANAISTLQESEIAQNPNIAYLLDFLASSERGITR